MYLTFLCLCYNEDGGYSTSGEDMYIGLYDNYKCLSNELENIKDWGDDENCVRGNIEKCEPYDVYFGIQNIKNGRIQELTADKIQVKCTTNTRDKIKEFILDLARIKLNDINNKWYNNYEFNDIDILTNDILTNERDENINKQYYNRKNTCLLTEHYKYYLTSDVPEYEWLESIYYHNKNKNKYKLPKIVIIPSSNNESSISAHLGIDDNIEESPFYIFLNQKMTYCSTK